MLKKYSVNTAWAMLFVWIFYTILHTAFVVLELNMHHQKVAQKLKKKKEKNLVSLAISTKDNTFIRVNKKEFIWQNEWYDIEQMTEKDGLLYIVAYPDKKEEKLQKRLQKALEHEQEHQKNKNNVKLELKETFVNTVQFCFVLPSIRVYLQAYHPSNWDSFTIPFPTPPPEKAIIQAV